MSYKQFINCGNFSGCGKNSEQKPIIMPVFKSLDRHTPSQPVPAIFRPVVLSDMNHSSFKKAYPQQKL
jgi:hypothetical protein